MKNVCHSGLPRAGHPPDVCVADGDGEADGSDGEDGGEDGGDDGEDDCDTRGGETSREGRGVGEEDMVKKDCATNGDDH